MSSSRPRPPLLAVEPSDAQTSTPRPSSPIQTGDGMETATAQSPVDGFDPPPSSRSLELLAAILEGEAFAAKDHRRRKGKPASPGRRPRSGKPPVHSFMAVQAGSRP